MEDISVIDSSYNILHLMDQSLTHRGYTVKTADNGIEGIRIFNEKRHFKLVITDIRMPGADGNQVAKYMKDNEETKNTTIIAISAYIDDGEREGCTHQITSYFVHRNRKFIPLAFIGNFPI